MSKCLLQNLNLHCSVITGETLTLMSTFKKNTEGEFALFKSNI